MSQNIANLIYTLPQNPFLTSWLTLPSWPTEAFCSSPSWTWWPCLCTCTCRRKTIGKQMDVETLGLARPGENQGTRYREKKVNSWHFCASPKKSVRGRRQCNQRRVLGCRDPYSSYSDRLRPRLRARLRLLLPLLLLLLPHNHSYYSYNTPPTPTTTPTTTTTHPSTLW